MSTSPLAYDPAFWRTQTAAVKIASLVSILIGLLCIVCSPVAAGNARGVFYLAVGLFSFAANAALLLAQLYQLWPRKFHDFNAALYESHAHWALAGGMFVAAATALSLDVPTYTAAAFFGLVAFCLHAVDAHRHRRLGRQCTTATQTEEPV